MTKLILEKRISLQQESNELENKLKAEQSAHDKELAESRKLLSQLQQEVLEIEKEKNMLTSNKEQTDALYLKLGQAQEMTNRILQKRIEIDGELTRLQRQYKNDSKFWQDKMEREVSIQQKAAAEARAELEMLKKKEAALEAERNDLGSLVGQTFKVMFGLK
jgi:chromosome segregation ATPase